MRIPSGEHSLAWAIIFATLIVAWMFRFETYDPVRHQNRFTGAICLQWQECWIPGNYPP
jgi:hypothetical protein